MTSTTIAIIGQGRVATHLRMAFADSANIVPVNSRSLENLPREADLYIIAVSDSAIGEVAERLASEHIDGIVAHTSGSTPISTLSDALPLNQVGILYPLQTFSHGVPVNYSEIPFFVMAHDENVAEKLKQICSQVSIHVHRADSEILSVLHAAAVFTCNFTNAMVAASDEILRDKGMNYSILLPLLKETVSKLERLEPTEAQTGPAKRNDMNTITAHRKLLAESNQNLIPIYDTVSDYILTTNKKKSSGQ